MSNGTPTVVHTPALIALLHSPEVQQISFTAESVRVTGADYNLVALALSSGKITVELDATLTPDNPAKYFADRNVISVRPNMNLAQIESRLYAVHEMTHALIDMMALSKSRGLHRTEGEGIAYISECLYMYYSGRKIVSPEAWPRLFRVADRIRKRIIDHGHHVVTKDEMRELRNAVGHHKQYRNVRGMLVKSDG